MRIVYRQAESEAEGTTQNLSTLGTFVLSERSPDLGELDLRLDVDGDTIELSGEVVRHTSTGFAVVFSALHPDTLNRLGQVLNPDQLPDQIPSFESESGDPVSEEPAIAFAGLDWSPPVTEPTLHQWQPDTALEPPPEKDGDDIGWERLPTISQSIDRSAPQKPPAQAEAPAPQAASQAASPQPEQQPAASEDPADQRLSVRHDKSIPVEFDNLTTLIKEFTHNISFGGLFVYTSEPMVKDSETAITLIHPVHGERMTLLAKVVHCSNAPSPDPATGKPRHGIGLEFRLPIEELKRVLSDFISSHQQPDAAPPPPQVVTEAQAVLNRGASSYHALLGVPETATSSEVRNAYFKLVDRFHPDRYFGKVNANDRKILEELFRKLTKAYEELAT